MKPKNNSLAGIGLLTAITASLCCVTPVLAFIAGASGVAATFSWLEPFRSYLIGLTALILGFAWYQKLKPRLAERVACACEDDKQPSFWQSKRLLAIVTLITVVLILFPVYSNTFFPDSEKQVIAIQESNIQEVKRSIKGMTCTGCEEHVKHTALQLDGVLEARASYKEGTTHIKFDQGTINVDEIAKVVEKETGYTVMNKQKL